MALTLSAPHATIVSLSYMVEKVPAQDLFSAQSLAESGMIDFLDDANKYVCQNRTTPSGLPAPLLPCQI